MKIANPMKTEGSASTVRYQLNELIGQGANGCVYRAVRSVGDHFSQAVAVKILNSEKMVAACRDEFASLSRVASPRCVQVFGFEWIDGRPALILELVEGMSLAELSRWSELTSGEIVGILQGILAGLVDLSSFGLCHGDLSPNNVLIDQKGRIRLVDFGFGNSARGRRQVTPAYAAPELLRGTLPSPASDRFSLGKITEELVDARAMRSLFDSFISQLISENPDDREVKTGELPSAPSDEADLGQRVIRALARRRETVEKTVGWSRPLVESREGETMGRSARGPFRLALGALILASASSSLGRGAAVNQRASLRIRTNQWVAIELNEESRGYAPLDFDALEPGAYRLKWRSAQGEGARTLTLAPGDHIVIGDFPVPSP